MLVRGDFVGGVDVPVLIEQIQQTPNISVKRRTQVVEVHGENRLETISIRCGDSAQVDRVPASALFIFIGAVPEPTGSMAL